MRLARWDYRCEYCGRFCKPVDVGTYYGSTLDLEPPEISCFCKKCVDEQLKHPENVIVGCWWIKPSFVLKAEKQRKHK